MPYKTVQHYEKNILGVDYAVGDIHGMFHNLQKLLIKIGFDPKKDRLFSTGDLCSRGSHNNEVLNWLSKSWLIPAKGNHEQIILDFATKKVGVTTLHNTEDTWWLTLLPETQHKILSHYAQLPLALDVVTDLGLVGILHAECPHADWSELERCFTGMHKEKFKHTCLWSTNAILNEDVIRNVDAVVVGHMTHKEYTQRGNVHFIDTGSGYSHGKLTILNLNTLESYSE